MKSFTMSIGDLPVVYIALRLLLTP
jgi:hypothetical protein